MGKFFEKYRDYLFPSFMFLFFTAIFIFHFEKLSNCTTWDKTAFKSLTGCIQCGWLTIIWLLNIKQVTDNRHFEEIKKLLGEKK